MIDSNRQGPSRVTETHAHGFPVETGLCALEN